MGNPSKTLTDNYKFPLYVDGDSPDLTDEYRRAMEIADEQLRKVEDKADANKLSAELPLKIEDKTVKLSCGNGLAVNKGTGMLEVPVDGTTIVYGSDGLTAVGGGGGGGEGRTYTGVAPIKVDNAKNQISLNAKGITSEFIADGAITTDKIADDAITSDKIADGAITADKIQDGALTPDKLDPGSDWGSIGGGGGWASPRSVGLEYNKERKITCAQYTGSNSNYKKLFAPCAAGYWTMLGLLNTSGVLDTSISALAPGETIADYVESVQLDDGSTCCLIRLSLSGYVGRKITSANVVSRFMEKVSTTNSAYGGGGISTHGTYYIYNNSRAATWGFDGVKTETEDVGPYNSGAVLQDMVRIGTKYYSRTTGEVIALVNNCPQIDFPYDSVVPLLGDNFTTSGNIRVTGTLSKNGLTVNHYTRVASEIIKSNSIGVLPNSRSVSVKNLIAYNPPVDATGNPVVIPMDDTVMYDQYRDCYVTHSTSNEALQLNIYTKD